MKTTLVFLILCASTLSALAQEQPNPTAPIEMVYRDSLKRLDYFDSLNIWAHDPAVHSLLFGSRIRAYQYSQGMRPAHDSLLAYQAELAQMIHDGRDSIYYCDDQSFFGKAKLLSRAGYRGMLVDLRAQLANDIRTWNAFVRMYPPIYEHNVTAAEKAEGEELTDDN